MDRTGVRRWVGWYLAVGGWLGLGMFGVLAVVAEYRQSLAGVQLLPVMLAQLLPAWCGAQLLRGTRLGDRWAPLALWLQVPEIHTQALWYEWFDGLRLVPYLRIRDAVGEVNFDFGLGASTNFYVGRAVPAELAGINLVAVIGLIALKWAGRSEPNPTLKVTARQERESDPPTQDFRFQADD